MKSLVEWLIFLEDRASSVYEDLAVAFKEDTLFSKFLDQLAEDESMHYHFMNSALICLKKNPHIVSEIELNQQDTELIEQGLERIESVIKAGALNKSLMLELILNCEYSEWNEIFLYVINSLKTNCPHFKVTGPSIQNHHRIIEEFLREISDGSDYIQRLRKLSPVWREKILVVDDTKPILDLLSSVLSRDATVETAHNGKEAFRMACSEYYAVIISDIDMPEMDGITFYQELKQRFDDVGKRFIFMSGAATTQMVETVNKLNIPLLRKPFTLTDVRKAVYKTLSDVTL
jgi:CheY-like chemotaxis protein